VKSLGILLVAVMVLYAIGPLYLLIKISLSPPDEVLTAHPTLVPHSVTGRYWARVLSSGQITAPMRKSLVVASAVAIFAIALGAPAAYSLIQLPLRWRYGILLGLFLCRMLPEVSIAMPIAVVFIRWGLIDTQTGLMLAHLTMALPVVVWVLTTTFETIPRQVEEAAALDGCGTWLTLLCIMLPLALPGLVVGGLLAWLFSWEEFVLATYLTLGDKTMPLLVYYYLYQGNVFITAVAAILMALPVLLLSFFLQHYLRETNLAGVMR
jgi:trehalose transport system permease protein